MVYFLKQKNDTIKATVKYLADVASYGKVKRLRSDNGVFPQETLEETLNQARKRLVLRTHFIKTVQ